MNLKTIGQIIAERELSVTNDEGRDTVLVVKIGIPQKFPDSSDYYVPYQIDGMGSETVRYAGGIDAVQALQGAMILIGADLYALNETLNRRLRWIGDEEGDLGFPMPNEIES
jgi:hypothetical protein